MRRITKAALGGLATSALILGATQAAGGASPNVVYSWSGPLADLQPGVTGPLDGASASLRIIESPDEGTGFRLRVTGIQTEAEFGAHLHVGPCTAGVVFPDLTVSADTTGGHYKSDGPATIANPATPQNEVWFNLVPDDEGVANDETWVSFDIKDTISPGVMSIVLHALPTDPNTHNGFAGMREACLPVTVADWAV